MQRSVLEVCAASAPESKRPLHDAGPIEHIAVFRALQLGDLLCAVPALRALRAAYPKARVTLIGLPWAHAFATRFRHYLDDFIPFPGAPGLPERQASATEVGAFRRRVEAARFDLALQLHGNGSYSNGLVADLGARLWAGFHPPGARAPEGGFSIAYPDGEPEVRRLLRLLAFLGIPARGEGLEFPIAPDEWREFARVRERFGLQLGRYVCLHPGGRAPARRWAPEGFARVADRLAGRGLQVVLTGTAEEGELTRAVSRAMLAPSVNLAGEAVMGVLAALFAGARLVVCNDTAVSHFAAALRVPSVVVFTGSSPQRWAPLDRKLHRAVYYDVDCRPCAHVECPIGQPCATNVSADDVMREAEVLLAEPRRRGNGRARVLE